MIGCCESIINLTSNLSRACNQKEKYAIISFHGFIILRTEFGFDLR